ncbi:RimK family alpha-L-glutamate ligase [Tenacibaculum singaporense]|uniref:ATP-grasp domain-containing protein n=1 Tax=Tenacibaculum singaporense TaxID=2358479 RepID=UPI0035161320
MKIAILYDVNERLHTTNWSLAWEEYCKKNNIAYQIVNPYKIEVVKTLLKFDIILWHYSNYSFKDMLMAKNVLNTLEDRGKKVFPSFKDAWHFDDKLAETYLLESVEAPMPKSFYYYSLTELDKAINDKKMSFPIIAKLRGGSGSHNVKKIDSVEELRKYGKQMFTSGLSSAPSLMYKASSNIKSSKNLKIFIKRAKRIPEFLRSLSNAKKFNIERGYVYLQEFIPNDGYDLKVVVVGDKLSFIGRNIREGEYRASGGGSLFYEREKVTKEVIDSAFKTSDELGFKCMGYDYVVNSKTGKGIIIEISYGFSHQALLDANGYFDRNGKWHEEPLNVPYEIIENLKA